MTKDERNELKNALLEVFNSEEGQEAIKRGTLSTLASEEGQEAIKSGMLKTLRSKEGKEVFSDLFVENFKEVVVPAFVDHEDRIVNLEHQQMQA